MNISDQLSITARDFAAKTAYIFQDQETTYQQLDGAVTRFASGLRKIGLQEGDHVALMLGNSPHFVIGMYGALRSGLTVIPINPLYTPDELTYILMNGDVKAVITMDLFIEKFEKIDAYLPMMEHYIVAETSDVARKSALQNKMIAFTDVVETGSLQEQFPIIDDDDVAVILYTSGTTGNPKGAMLTHRNLYSNAKDSADYLGIQTSDKVIAALPMFHVFCLTVSLNAPLMNGGTVIIVPKFSPAEVFRLAIKWQATVFAGVPTMYNYLLQAGELHKEDLRSLRLCISGGASMPVALLQQFEATFDCIVSEGFGLSEASPVTCFNPLDKPRKPGSIGQNIVNVENKVVDEFGEEVEVGQVGELIVRGPNVMKGYYKMPEETEHALRDGWLYTGDMARMDEEGYFYIVDRKKDMILVGGYNVYPREVEEVLYRHPNVTEVAVIGVPDPNVGEAVQAFVVLKEDGAFEEELLAYSRERLAKYKVPSSIHLIDELPKNTTGKILRRNLREKIVQS
ncbi:fatty acid--CoA ligase family protein [Pontibacillus litoralis]|uniref:Long-chain fatty acid--CoA ligase n=1 Tax=Pontibacillus litoralis JSM 072002 TaxID=1385512 RepID=A0A0A5FYC3_9BACI|nr:fatty acid--CoA ligase family protein [Pontibacillus litoralis]KGX84794.1 long-chain fatty acid--CoA ligase [Pontibacillus litoralis JSM 072002]